MQKAENTSDEEGVVRKTNTEIATVTIATIATANISGLPSPNNS